MAKLKVQYIAVDELLAYERNTRTHSKEQVAQIANSIREFGFTNPVLVDAHNVLIAGHGRAEAAKVLGMTEVPCIRLGDLTEAQANALRIADNSLALNAGWDTEALKVELEALEAADFDVGLLGLDSLEIDGLNLVDVNMDEGAEIEEDEPPAPEDVEHRCKRGEIWQLGEHRLMCGDSTSAEDVARLMDGEKADLVFTDPPYGVNIVKKNTVGGSGALHFGKVGGSHIVQASTYKAIKGDDTTDTARLNYQIIKDISDNQIIFGGNYFTDFLPPKACWCIWDKENTGNFADVEMAWTSFDKGAKLYKWLWNGLCRKGERSVEGKSRVHPTQKPVGLVAEILNDFTKEANIILDCFGGSGSTLIACEQIGRKCRMMEFEEHYCDVILTRWETLTGKTAKRLT